MRNKIITYTICIDTKSLKDLNDIEDEIKGKLKEASSKLYEGYFSKK